VELVQGRIGSPSCHPKCLERRAEGLGFATKMRNEVLLLLVLLWPEAQQVVEVVEVVQLEREFVEGAALSDSATK